MDSGNILKALLVFAICVSRVEAQKELVRIEETGTGFAISFGGDLFTRYVQGEQKAFLYPVIGPTGIDMSRGYPVRLDVPGESRDHPWHVGIFYSLGSVNGLDFWNERIDEHENYRIELLEVEKVGNLNANKVQLVVSNKWTINHEILMTDRTEIEFSGDDSKRIVDYRITLIASHGDVNIGDSKEGSMAIRMSDKFRVKDQDAKVVNSDGVVGKEVWGKKARWVCYYNEFDGETLGITLFDHPSNLRYPTTWHARGYGLFGANPFGLSHFLPGEGVTGDVVLKEGETLTFTHRFIFHKGSPVEAKIDELHSEWIQR